MSHHSFPAAQMLIGRMRKIPNLYFLPIFFLALLPFAEAKEWRKIIPLHTTRADVERVLGRTADGYNRSYYLKDSNVFIAYSEGNCKDGNSLGWNVPADTVIHLTVVLKNRPKLSELNIDITEFKIRNDSHVPDVLHYTSEEGLILEVYKEQVQTLIYFHSSKDEHLRCK